MKRILFFLSLLPYLASAQVAKDTVTVLTIAQIPAGAIRDTTNFTFVQDNAFRKATFDSLYKYTRVKLLAAGAITSAELANALSNETGSGAAVFATSPTLTTPNLGTPSAAVLTSATGLPIATGLSGLGAANRIPYATSATAMATSAGLTFDGTNFATTGAIRAARGTTTAPGFAFGDDTNTGVFSSGADSISFVTGGSERIRIGNQGRFIMGGNYSTYNTGSGLQWDNVGLMDYNANALIFRGNNHYDNTDFRQESLKGGNFYGLYYEMDILHGNHNWSSAPQVANAFDPQTMTVRMKLTEPGELWIGYATDNGAYPLQVNGQIFATNATIATSDGRYKENIMPLQSGLAVIEKLNPVTYNFITDNENNFSEYPEVGFIAQDIDRALSKESYAKSIVKNSDDSDPDSPMGIAAGNLIPLLVKAIQEQQTQIEQLKQRIIQLENK